MNPFRWTFRSQCLAGFAACAALIGFAIYSQFAWGLEPCPMCIFQRLAFAALGLVFLVAGLHAPRAAGTRGVYGVVGFLAAAVGMGLAGRHVWLQLNPPDVPGCLPPLSFMRETMSTTGVIRRVLTGSGDCSAVDWSFLGLSMPAWSLVWFIALGLFFLFAAFRARRRGQR
ncbi:disulfide bond formation protein B [Luteimonas sp. Sa2BVA3]|uniref:Disulfide bond formation protein B n=1 Tax=Luteimonas colneyensis TaxID=2762230 RepID=A0ABR8UID0_9GAMM|nr:disulfide bond formation protein B [Luteimonas colneyensis]MBD7987768.1 disulfide bond formation protein B [Luteimonas colneyensis]